MKLSPIGTVFRLVFPLVRSDSFSFLAPAWLGLIFVVGLPLQASAEGETPAVTRKNFGTMPDGAVVEQFNLDNHRGMTVKIITYGATIVELAVPDRVGQPANVVHGSNQLSAYLAGFPAASVMGRVVNRIAGARFELDGREYKLTPGPRGYHMHGGAKGFSKVVWQADVPDADHRAVLRLTHTSPDGEDGYPGKFTATVTYTVTDQNGLRIEYSAVTDQAGPVNLTNHAFFNLSGEGDIGGEEVRLNADRYTPVDANKIPTGEIKDVAGTPFDLRAPVRLASRIGEAANGFRYDHNFVVNRADAHPDELVLAAQVRDPESGRALDVWTTEPGIQFVTTGPGRGTGGPRFGAICLEAQHFPDSVNHPNFPSTILRPGQTYHSVTEYRFSVL